MSCERQFLKEFIETYRDCTCLWKKTDSNYHNAKKRDVAYNLLLEKFKVIEPHATKATVTRKINSLRSCYRKEFKKVAESLKPGADISEKYEPSLWYFNLLSFLKDHQEISSQETYITEDINEDNSNVSEQDSNITENDICSLAFVSSNLEDSSSSPNPQPQESLSYLSNSGRKRKIKEFKDDFSPKIVNITSSRLEPNNVLEHSAFSAHVAHELRSMSPEMIPFVKKLINDAIFEGHMKTLNRYSRIEIQPP